MKITKLVTLATIVAALAFAGEGCKKGPVRTTALPGQGYTEPGKEDPNKTPLRDPNLGGGLASAPSLRPITAEPPIATPPPTPNVGGGFDSPKGSIEGWPQDRDWGKSFTIYFDFDRSVVKSSEAVKLDGAAAKFKDAPANAALLIEGHCDERGTAEYNRALGERRAMAIREKLIAGGINPERIHTVTFGKDKPAAFGHDESAWSKNRRGEFILCTPPK